MPKNKTKINREKTSMVGLLGGYCPSNPVLHSSQHNKEYLVTSLFSNTREKRNFHKSCLSSPVKVLVDGSFFFFFVDLEGENIVLQNPFSVLSWITRLSSEEEK